MRARTLAMLPLLAIVAAVGCRTPRETWSGEASFRVVRPPSPPSSRKGGEVQAEGPRQVVVEAEAILPLQMPVYPPAALAARAGAATVGVSIVIDDTGRVASVEPTPAVLSTPGPYAAEFLEAVRTAVSQWYFRPAELLDMVPVPKPDGRIEQQVRRRQRVEAEITVEFRFTAQGKVELP